MNEDKSIVRGSEEIPNVNEESIRFLSGLWLVKRKNYSNHLYYCNTLLFVYLVYPQNPVESESIYSILQEILA